MHDLSEPELLETLQQLKEIAEILQGNQLSKAMAGRSAAARALATEAATEPFLMDMWEDGRTPETVAALVKQTLEHGEKILANKRKPDDREAILAGDEFGVVFMPPELLRQLWGLGEAVVNFQDKRAKVDQVEPRALQVMELAGQWVRDARDRWGALDRVEKVDVAPLMKHQVDENPPF